MVFSSVSFVFLFLPLISVLYWGIRRDVRNFVLLGASILFYAWGEPLYLWVMIVAVLTTFSGAILIDRFRCRSKLLLFLFLSLNLGFLFYFKYFGFVVDNLNALLRADMKTLEIVMPIGISFYMFQAMSYLIDVYRGTVPVQKDLYKLALYIVFFPQLIAGPIVKYHDIAAQIDGRTETFDKVVYGVKRFIVGLAKKVLIANTMGAVADKVFAQSPAVLETPIAWLGAVAYTFQIYYDFSGYSDMAIGLGAIFGFKFLENFNYPYIAKSVTEFWRRWHISLSTWFKEYLYIPLGGNRVSKIRGVVNLAIVFLVTGIWHGAAWTFVVWGLWHGFFIVFEKLTRWHENEKYVLGHHLYCLLVCVVGWVVFRADTLRDALTYLKVMFFGNAAAVGAYDFAYYADRSEIITFAVAIACAMPLFSGMLTLSPQRRALYAGINVWLTVLFVFSVAALAASTYNPFIYFRF